MILFTLLVVLGGVLLALGVGALLLSNHAGDLRRSHRFLLLVAGPVDGVLSALLLDLLGVSTTTALVGGFVGGVLSMLFIQPMFIPQRLMVWRLARENLRRRKRQTALLIAGLVIASAIITSSLVVGDSLDATVASEVEAAWGETDVSISGLDPMTGSMVRFEEALAERFWLSAFADDAVGSALQGRQYGITATVSLTAPSGLGEPSVAFFARNASVDEAGIWSPLDLNDGYRFSTLETLNGVEGTPSLAINEVAAEQLELRTGQTVELGFFVVRDGEMMRTSVSFLVDRITPNTGQGAMAGSLSPAVFLDLGTAQSIMEMEGEINTLSLAFASGITDDELRSMVDRVDDLLNASMTAEDAGMVFTTEPATSSLSISSQRGLQRISGDDVVALRENLSELAPGVAMLEVLQAPLVDVSLGNESLLTLADAEVQALRVGEAALWHVASGGFGFEPLDGGDAWLWQANEGDLLRDVAWNASGFAALVAHRDGLLLVDEALDGTEVRETYETGFPTVAVASTSEGWLALEEAEGALYLHRFDADLSLLTTLEVDLERPSTVLGYELAFDGEVYLSVEGLLSTTYFVAPLDSEAFVATDATQWPVGDDEGDGSAANILASSLCNGVAAVNVSGGQWCTTSEGLARIKLTNGEVESLRLPVLSDAEGFGRFPQMVLAFGGENATLSVASGEMLTSQRLAPLEVDGLLPSLEATGALPYAYGNASSLPLTPSGRYTSLTGFEQLADLDAVVLGLVSLEDAEVLALAGEDDRSLLMFSGPGLNGTDNASLDALTAWFDERSTGDDIHLAVRAVKLDAKEQAEASSGVLSAMFLVFGTFTIAAGVLLSLTIIMLLADVRRSELATARALGLRRSDARAMFVYEGALASMIAGGLGSVLGLFLAWLISVGFSSIFQSVGAQRFSFSWTLDSFMAGWVWGALLSLLLLLGAAAYNAQLNIVRALKGGRTPVPVGVPWGLFIVQIVGLGSAFVCGAGLFLFGFESALAYAAYIGTGVGLLLAFVPLFSWELPVWRARGVRTSGVRHAARNTLGALGVLFLLWTSVLDSVDPFRANMEANELAFIAIGLLQVLAGVMVLTSWAPMLVQFVSKRALFGGGPVRAVALAHPLAHPVRTAVVMGMFSITMFSVVVLAGYTEQFDTYSADFVEEAEGDFELLLTSSRSRPITLDADADEWGVNASIMASIDAVGAVHRAPVHLEDEDGERMPYILRGVDEGFITHGGLPLHLWDESLGSTSQEAWLSLGRFDDVVFLDASFGLESAADGTTIVPLQFSIGDSISLIDFSNPQNTKSVKVGGFLKQSSYIFSPGVWMGGDVVENRFGGEITRMYVSVAPTAQATDPTFLEMDLAAQGKTVEERQAAAELEEVLDRELARSNINVQTVADEIQVIQSLVLAILSLFEGYLALGLIVGVAGIGVVTVRNVSERRRTVGMLRAIGFRQSHVHRMFSTEISWVAVLGMLNGLLIGYGFHAMLYNALWAEEGVAFSFPWLSTVGVFVFGWLVVLATTAAPVRQAAKIPPSAALRTR